MLQNCPFWRSTSSNEAYGSSSQLSPGRIKLSNELASLHHLSSGRQAGKDGDFNQSVPPTTTVSPTWIQQVIWGNEEGPRSHCCSYLASGVPNQVDIQRKHYKAGYVFLHCFKLLILYNNIRCFKMPEKTLHTF